MRKRALQAALDEAQLQNARLQAECDRLGPIVSRVCAEEVAEERGSSWYRRSLANLQATAAENLQRAERAERKVKTLTRKLAKAESALAEVRG